MGESTLVASTAKLTRQQLSAVPTPLGTATHRPVPHDEVVEALVETLTFRHIAVVKGNPFSFPDTTINSTTPVPVVINATNLPVNASVTLYLLSDTSPNQAIPVTLTGNDTTSTATVPVTFASGGTRGFVKAKW